MAAKNKILAFSCSNCGAAFPKWLGKCSECGEFNTVTELSHPVRGSGTKAHRVRDLKVGELQNRQTTSLDYLDKLLGDGLPSGTVVLLAGEPGIGKSTLLFQMILKQQERSLYVSAEESVEQIARRFRTLEKEVADELFVISENHVSRVLEQIETLKPKIVVIDSIQMMVAENEERARGGMASLRETTEVLVQKAKELHITLWIVGHVNKEGDIAGPKTLEHLVDTVLIFSMAEDSRLRILQVQKHRFGRSGEVLLLEMSERGLTEKKESDSYWIHKRSEKISGCALAAVQMGSRVICVEVQALVVDSYFPSPRRSTSGFDLNRLHLILAVLEKRLKVPFSRSDVYLNIVGGLKVSDPGADLAVAAALVSAQSEKAISTSAVFCGEIGLTGELRKASAMEDRLRSVVRMGFSQWISAPFESLKASAGLRASSFEQVRSALEFLI
jgi:DNA repair protein RadA/Sms